MTKAVEARISLLKNFAAPHPAPLRMPPPPGPMPLQPMPAFPPFARVPMEAENDFQGSCTFILSN